MVEILISISVIAIIAGIAIPMMSDVFQRSQETAARRNAQAIAGVASSATAAGSKALETVSDVEAAIDLLVEGVNGEGQFAENVFMVSIKPEDREKTIKYLEFEDGRLAFDPSKD